MQKQGSIHRSVISMLNKILDNHFTISNNYADTAVNFIKLFLFPWIRIIPASIRLDENVLIKTNIFALLLCLHKTSSTRLLDVLVKTNIFALVMRLQDVFKTFLRCLQDVLKTFSRRLHKVLEKRFHNIFKASSELLQDILKTSWIRLQDIFKTSCKDVFKTF